MFVELVMFENIKIHETNIEKFAAKFSEFDTESNSVINISEVEMLLSNLYIYRPQNSELIDNILQ